MNAKRVMSGPDGLKFPAWECGVCKSLYLLPDEQDRAENCCRSAENGSVAYNEDDNACCNEAETESLLFLCRSLFRRTDGESRMAFVHSLLEGYCDDCGRELTDARPVCYCSHDD